MVLGNVYSLPEDFLSVEQDRSYVFSRIFVDGEDGRLGGDVEGSTEFVAFGAWRSRFNEVEDVVGKAAGDDMRGGNTDRVNVLFDDGFAVDMKHSPEFTTGN